MAEDCVFCKIVRHEAPASRVYEDKDSAAFLSIRPINEGHTLVVPKKHYENIYEVPDEEVASLFQVVKKVAIAVRNAISAEGVRIVQNNGSAAGQVVFHLHVHIIPEYNEWTDERTLKSPDEPRVTADKIRTYLHR
jgi:histidine triad (HIT) family protein